jgi:hypothetical protein
MRSCRRIDPEGMLAADSGGSSGDRGLLERRRPCLSGALDETRVHPSPSRGHPRGRRGSFPSSGLRRPPLLWFWAAGG